MNFSMLLTNNNRSKAYLQNLIKNNFIPSKILFLNNNNKTLIEHTENDKLISEDTNQIFVRKLIDLDISFDEKEHVLKTIKKNKISFVEINNLDVNSKDVVEEVANIEDNYIIYSGPSSYILGKEILSKNKKFIHVHPGLLPAYRGSTTIYYSMLLESKIGCSVIFLNERIDEGPLLYKKEYKISEKGIDFDYVLDPLIRSKALVEYFKISKINPSIQESNEGGSIFYVIHPLLKHLSIIKYNKEL
ncbi:formyltransferase family protein [Candidatus Pelagibacter sp.]|uniref:formyltransferase family protein n=2 Tax=unclassified Candidatus Pelagibacter TaxID=2647897 RepID=UPI003F82F32F